MFQSGFRWYARCYCVEKEAFIAINLNRLLSLPKLHHNALTEQPACSQAHKDTQWQQWFDLTLIANPLKSEAEQRLIAMEYSFEDNELTIYTRQAMIPYLLSTLGIDLNRNAPFQKLTVKDPASVTDYLFPA